MAGSFIEQLETKIGHELRYAAGVLRAYRERERDYRRDHALALLRHDNRRCHELEDDLTTFRREVARVEARQQSASARLRLLRGGAPWPAAPYVVSD